MATVVPTGLEGLGPAMSQLGEALGQIIFQDQIRQRRTQEALADPEAAQAVRDQLFHSYEELSSRTPPAPAMGGAMAEQAGQLQVAELQEEAVGRIADATGMHPDVLRNLWGLPESEGARRELLRRDQGLDRLETDAEKRRLEVELEELEAEELTAEAAIRRLRTERTLLVPEARARLEALTTEAAISGSQNQLDALERYSEWIEQLPPELQMAAVMAFANPRFLDHLEHLDNLDLSMQRLMMQMMQNQADQWETGITMLLRLDNQLSDQMDRVRQLEDEGEGAEGEWEAEMMRLTELAALRRRLASDVSVMAAQGEGVPVPIGDTELEGFIDRRAVFSDRPRIEVRTPATLDERLAMAWEATLSTLVRRVDEPGEVVGTLMEMSNGPAFWDQLGPDERAQFLDEFTRLRRAETAREAREVDPRRQQMTPVGRFLDDIDLFMSAFDDETSVDRMGSELRGYAIQYDMAVAKGISALLYEASQLREAWTLRQPRREDD